MLRLWRRLMILGAALLLLCGGFMLYFWQRAVPEEMLGPTVVLASPAPAPDFSAVLIQESGAARRVLQCSAARCVPELLPGSISDASVFDGEGWLYYQEAESAVSKLTKKILLRTVPGKETTQLIEETPLTSPRDLIISPTGKHTAFFLDNIDRPDEELTELWLYDREKNGVQLIAEKLYRPDIRSRVRWNRAGNAVWFLADTGAQDNPEDVLALVVVPIAGSAATPFAKVDWQEIAEVIDHGVMDISPSGKILAYAAPTFFGNEELRVVAVGQGATRLSVKGAVVYSQFLEDDSLVYGVQDSRGVTFWKLKDAVARYVARQPEQLLTAQGDVSGEFILTALQSAGRAPITIRLLHTPTGSVTTHASVAGESTRVLLTQLSIKPPHVAGAAAGASGELEDAEIAAFIDQNFARVAGNEVATARRFLITDQPNTVFIDYTSRAGAEERLLVTIHDLAHVDWSIKGRYRAAQAEWQKIQGGGLPDPAPVRLYEWEETVEQWILKTSF